MFRIHFPFLDPSRDALSLTCALRAGGLSGATGRAGPEYEKYAALNAQAANHFQVVGLADAQVLIYPHMVYPQNGLLEPQVEMTADEARKRKIGCIFFSSGDAGEQINVPYGTVYRQSLFTDLRLPNEQAAPAEVADPQVEMNTTLSPRDFPSAPSVGFCGYVSNPLVRWVYRRAGRIRKAEGLQLRARALRALRRTRGVGTNFIVRQMYRAGMRGRFHHFAKGEYKPRAQFWDNIFSNDYTLCLRGAGNFSYRLYEVLASARIPLFINTNCVLPLQDEIDWKRHCVWVEEDQIDSAGKILLDFHSRLTPEEFRNLQLANRRLWEEKLSPLGFWKAIVSREITAPIPAPEAPHYYYNSSQSPPSN
jgi:Exostosin family